MTWWFHCFARGIFTAFSGCADYTYTHKAQAAKLINASLDLCVDPCEDFYSYACGGWKKNHPIPESKSYTGIFPLLRDELQGTLRSILENMTLNYECQNVTDKAAVAYNACMAVPALEDRLDVMMEIMNASGVAQWPITNDTGGMFKNCTEVLNSTGIFTIFSVQVTRDAKELNSSVIMVRLLDLLKKQFSTANITLSDNETVELYALDYYSGLNSFLASADPKTLYNYAGLKVMLGFGAQVSDQFRNASFELSKAITGVVAEKPRWETCVRIVNEAMPEIVGLLYVQHKFSKEAKAEVEDLARRLMAVFNETLQNAQWMDNETRRAAEEKLYKMGTKIGYPEWLYNVTYLERIYQYVPDLCPNCTFAQMLHWIYQNRWVQQMLKLRQPYDKDADWTVGTAVVNAFYNPSTNEMPSEWSGGHVQGYPYINNYLILQAYSRLLKDEYGNNDTRLPGLEHLSGKKLFFLSNAMVWCSNIRPGDLRQLIQYDPHSPDQYRVNVPMSNMRAFSTVFNCSANSTMNRTRRCTLW
ncbi:hypothetical protein V5799_002161 [Amblyomma americanum]|uniref:M13 family peptidase n=1 Tax=Amblyomma americanum TaxID=6943 RepID=A0AAQ4CY40_AMBAM